MGLWRHLGTGHQSSPGSGFTCMHENWWVHVKIVHKILSGWCSRSNRRSAIWNWCAILTGFLSFSGTLTNSWRFHQNIVVFEQKGIFNCDSFKSSLGGVAVERQSSMFRHKTGSGCRLDKCCQIRVKGQVFDFGLGLHKYILQNAIIWKKFSNLAICLPVASNFTCLTIILAEIHTLVNILHTLVNILCVIAPNRYIQQNYHYLNMH